MYLLTSYTTYLHHIRFAQIRLVFTFTEFNNFSQKCPENSDQKDQIILATGQGIFADFWISHKIESCNFQNLLCFRFSETSQNLISLRQLLFSLFQII